MFAALFGENGVISGMFEEFEALPKLLHEKPWLPLAADLLQLSINIGLIWFFHELGAAIGLTSIAGEFAGMLTESGVAGAEAAAVGEIFEQLGGRELGYTVRICNESTVIETESGFENVGQLAKNQGGAYTNTATKTVWIDESVVTQGSITRAWGEQLTTRQILAHELGHVRGGLQLRDGVEDWCGPAGADCR
jgi:hypothetical protein